jgi:hypothetical protein
MKWKPIDWSKHPYPERQNDYLTYEALEDANGNWLATIEQFVVNEKCFYANTNNERSGCLGTYEWAKQWCEHRVGMQN